MERNISYVGAVSEYGTVSAAAKALGIARSTFDRRLAKETGESVASKAQPKPEPIRQSKPIEKKHGRGLTEEEFLLKYSPEHKIRYAAEQIEKGMFISEPEFLKGMSLPGGYRHVVDREEFQLYRGKASGGQWYWGHPERIAAMKADGILR